MAEIHFADHVALTGIHPIPTLCQWNIFHTVRVEATQDRRQRELGPTDLQVHGDSMPRWAWQINPSRKAIEILASFKDEE